jgi:hypothetical protein
MIRHDLFISVPNPQSGDAHRREAARIRGIAASATTPVMRRHLEDRARAHEALVGTAAGRRGLEPDSRILGGAGRVRLRDNIG